MTNKQKYASMGDEALMLAVAHDDVSAFTVLYQRYADRMLNYFYRMLNHESSKSQDFLQDLFLKVIQKSAMFNPNEKFSTWIFAIAHNMCVNEFRRVEVRQRAINEGKLNTDQQVVEDVDAELDLAVIEKAVHKEITKLDPEHRSTFLLRFREQLSIREISAILNCSEGTTKSRLFYTTRDLAFKLKQLNPF